MTRPPCLLGPAAVCPAPPNTMRSVHGPASAAAPLRPRPSSAGQRTRTGTQVRPGRSRHGDRAPSASGGGALPRSHRRHSKQEYDVVIISPRPLSNKSARRRLCPPFRPPEDVAPSAGGDGAALVPHSSLHEKGALVRIRCFVRFNYLSSSFS